MIDLFVNFNLVKNYCKFYTVSNKGLEEWEKLPKSTVNGKLHEFNAVDTTRKQLILFNEDDKVLLKHDDVLNSMEDSFQKDGWSVVYNEKSAH